jgi:hypothetical protein
LKQQAQNEEEMERMRDEYQHEIRELSKTHVAVLNEDDSQKYYSLNMLKKLPLATKE